MSAKKNTNPFADIIAARQQEPSVSESAAPEAPELAAAQKTERTSKRGNPDDSAVTVYIPTEIYARAQFEMTLQGRKREMSERFTELLAKWLAAQR